MKDNRLTVIMYHYVRDLGNSRFPNIKGCDFKLFKEQLLFLKKYYHFVTMDEVMDAFYNNSFLPEHSVLLTFDDAYKDHFEYVFPILVNEKIQGAFYPPVKAITEHTVLDVNKIHFILASVPNDEIDTLIVAIRSLLAKNRKKYSLASFDDYYKKLAIANRFDTGEVVFIKRLLQVELPEGVRREITNELFKKIVGVDESVFSRELYMSVDQMKCMVDCGMHIGSHGYDHYWLSSLTKDEQRNEIIKSMDFIRLIGGDLSKWTICYPYGDYNNDTINLLKQYGCKMGFCTKVGIASINNNNPDSIYSLSRLDVNDLPKSADAQPNEWYYS